MTPPRSKRKSLVLDTRVSGLLLLIALLALWELALARGWAHAVGWARPSAIAQSLYSLTIDGTLPRQVGYSLGRMAAGYSIATVLAIFIGLLMGSSSRIHNLLEPITEVLRPIPSPAYIPIVIIFLGFDEEMKVFMIAFSCFWPILLNTYSGVRAVDPVQLDTARTFSMSPLQTMVKVTLPAAAPFIVTGMRIALAVALIVMVIAEMVAANDGIGFFILNAQRNYMVKEMYAGVATLGALGYGLNQLFLALERKFMGWHYGATRKAN